MADKQATVRVTADPKGFINGMRQTEKAAAQAGQRIESSLSSAAKKAAAQFEKAAKAMTGAGARGADGRFLADGQLSKIKDMAKDVAKAYSDAYKEAVKLEQLRAQHAKQAAAAAEKSRKESVDTLKTIGGIAVAGAAGLGGKAIADANAVYEKATRLSISSRASGTEGVDPKALVGEFFAITQDIKGVTADQLADGAARFVQMTGDLATARSSLRDFATIAMASGASVEDVAGTAAAISQQFGLTDPGQIRDVLSALLFQGKAGAFELRDAASLFPRLAAAGASFGLDKGVGGIRTLGGLTQIARSGTGSGEQAATAVESMLTRLKTEAGKLESQGVKVYDKGKVRDLPDILVESIAKLGGTDIKRKNAALSQVYGEQGIRAINPLVAQYQDAFTKSKGKSDQERQAEAMEVLRQKIAESVNAAGDFTEAQRDAAMASSTFSSQMTASWERVTGGVADKVLPRLLGFGERLSKMDGVIDAFVGGLGLVVSALEQFNDVINAITGANQNNKFRSQYVNEAARERQRAEGMRAELAGMQMRPEAIAAMEQADPAELQRRREKARGLRERIDLAEATANLWDRKATDLKPSIGMSAEERAAAGRRAAGLEDVPMQGGAGRPVVKAELPDKEMRVRVTNPKDIGAQQGAPAPGWTPPRG